MPPRYLGPRKLFKVLFETVDSALWLLKNYKQLASFGHVSVRERWLVEVAGLKPTLTSVNLFEVSITC